MNHDGLLIGGAGNSKCFPVQGGKRLFYRAGSPGFTEEVEYVLEYFRVQDPVHGVRRGDYKIWRHGELPDASRIIELIRLAGLQPALLSD